LSVGTAMMYATAVDSASPAEMPAHTGQPCVPVRMPVV